jgi:hypothetical protein
VTNLDSISTSGAELRRLTLYLDGFDLGIAPEVVRARQLGFHLRRTDASAQAWSALLGKADGRGRAVTIGIGYAGQRELAQPDDRPQATLTLLPYRPWNLVAGAAVILVTLLSFIIMARHTGIIRDRGSETVPITRRPYSLSRFQMAVWFFVIFGSMLYIAVVLRDIVLTDQALLLLGIGTATQLGGMLVENAKTEDQRAPADAETQDFFRDLVTDAHGASFHRFQMLVWTVTLAGIFVWQVYDSLTMPVFPPSLLALMGISSGTYVTFKAYERQDGGARPARTGDQPAPAEPRAAPAAPGQVNVGRETRVFSASWAGDGEIAIVGENFTAGTTVALNGVTKEPSDLTVIDTQHLRLRVASGEAGPSEVVNLTIRNEDGTTENVQLT